MSCKTRKGLGAWTHWLEHAARGELHFEPHTHNHHDLGDIIQPHQHPHKTHYQGVARE
jgi:hypothetical protein